jgi:thiosulfate reductase cytochrome b subunit
VAIAADALAERVGDCLMICTGWQIYNGSTLFNFTLAHRALGARLGCPAK